MKRAASLLTLCLGLALSTPAVPLQAQAINPETGLAEFIGGHPPAMRRAIKEARAALPVVLSRTRTGNGAYASNLSFKVAFDTGSVTENIWVENIRQRGKGYSGTLGNTPRHMAGKRLGSKVRFEQAQVIDWALVGSDGLSFGHYTTRVIIKGLPADQARNYRGILTRRPLPKGFK